MNANAGRKRAHKSYLFPHWSNACPGTRLRVGITHQHLPLFLPRGSLLCDRGCSHCVHSPLSARDHPLWQKRWSLEVLQSSMGGSGILMPHIWKKRCEEASWFHGILDVVIEEQEEAYLGWHFFVFGSCWVQWLGRFCQVDEGDPWCRSDPTPCAPPPHQLQQKGLIQTRQPCTVETNNSVSSNRPCWHAPRHTFCPFPATKSMHIGDSRCLILLRHSHWVIIHLYSFALVQKALYPFCKFSDLFVPSFIRLFIHSRHVIWIVSI